MHLFAGFILFFATSLLAQAVAERSEWSGDTGRSEVIEEHRTRSREQTSSTATRQKILKSRDAKFKNMKDEENSRESNEEEATTNYEDYDNYGGQSDTFTDDEEPNWPAKSTPTPVEGVHVKALMLQRVNLPPAEQRRAYAMPRNFYKTFRRKNNRRYKNTRTGRRRSDTRSHGKHWKKMSVTRRKSLSKGTHNS